MPRRKPTEPVTVTTVHPEVWTDALRQAGGDASRIEVISETSVVVHNRSDWRSTRPAKAAPTTTPSATTAPTTTPSATTAPARNTPEDQPGAPAEQPAERPTRAAERTAATEQTDDEAAAESTKRPARPATQPFEPPTPPAEQAKPAPGPTVPVAAFVPPRLHSDT